MTQKISDVLLAAAEELDQFNPTTPAIDGWWWGAPPPSDRADNCLCAEGAIQKALDIPWPENAYEESKFLMDFEAHPVVKAMLEFLRESHEHDYIELYRWNDNVDRTIGDVANEFRNASHYYAQKDQ